MNPIQEAEFHLSVYHYFLWKSAQAKAKENAELQKQSAVTLPELTRAPAADPNINNNNTTAAADPNAATASADPNAAEVTEADEGAKKLPAKQATDTTTNGTTTAPAATTTTTAPTAAVVAQTTTPKPAASLRYHALVDAMLQQFPQHLAHFPPQNPMMTSSTPPIISTLYTDFPLLQSEIFAAHNKVARLESLLQQAQQENRRLNQQLGLKRKDPPLTVAAGSTAAQGSAARKRPRLNAAGAATKLPKAVNISSRPDVPDDVKKLVAEFRENANKQKLSEKRKVARLEAQVAKLKALADESEEAARPPPPPPPPDVEPAKPPKAFPMPSPWKSIASFEERVQELEHFRKGNGNCRVPLRTPGLGRWVGEMRMIYKNVQLGATGTVLTDENIALLEGMGFEWSVNKVMIPWEHRYGDLIKYKEKHGHCNVPRAYKEDPSLGEFVHMQRKLYRQKAKVMMESPGDGRKTRAERLEEIGFNWHTGAVKPSFEERLDECREYRRRHDHLKIPQPVKYSKEDQTAYESREERSFLQWAQRQRDEYRKYKEGMKSSLDKHRIRKLDALGFDWVGVKREVLPGDRSGTRGKPKNHIAFNERITLLREIKEKYGDCNDLKNLKDAGHTDSSPLYQWMKAQRKAWKAYKSGRWSSLTPERIGLLESLNFNFEPRKHYAAYGSKKSETDFARGVSGGDAATIMPHADVGGDGAIGELDQHNHDEESSDETEEEEEEEEEEENDEPPRPTLDYERYQV